MLPTVERRGFARWVRAIARGAESGRAVMVDLDRVRQGGAADASARGVGEGFVPRLELGETERAFVLRAELPGVEASGIELTLEGDRLVLRGERLRLGAASGERSRFTECAYGAFERTVRLPPEADTERVEADIVAGVLEVRIGKRAA